MTGPRFTRAQLESFHGAKVDDLVGPGLRLLFVGINPGLWTAAVNAHFARPGNRFWPALQLAGITAQRIDASRGLLPADRDELIRAGVGISNLVPFATARADELTAAQLDAAVPSLTELVQRTRPRVVAVLGLTAYRQAFDDRKATPGRQSGVTGRRRALGAAQPQRTERPRDAGITGRRLPGGRGGGAGVTRSEVPE